MGIWFFTCFHTKAVHIFRHLRAYTSFTSLYELHVLPEVACFASVGHWAAFCQAGVLGVRRVDKKDIKRIAKVTGAQVPSLDLLRCEVHFFLTTPFKHTSRSYVMT